MLNNSQKFESSDAPSEGRLGFGLWIIKQKRHFYIALVVLLVAVSAIVYGYNIYSYIDYFLFSGPAERANIANLSNSIINWQQQQKTNAPASLLQSDPQVFLSAGNYDFVAKLENPNSNFYAYFSYCFTDNGQAISCHNSFILPGEKKYLLSLGNKQTATTSLQLEIRDLIWQRLNGHLYPNWPNFSKNHLNFTTSNAKFLSGTDSGLSENIDLHTLEFSIKNDSAYNYWELPLNIILSDGSRVVSVNRYTLTEFYSGQTKDIRLAWPNSLPIVDGIAIIPDIDITRNDIYMPYK